MSNKPAGILKLSKQGKGATAYLGHRILEKLNKQPGDYAEIRISNFKNKKLKARLELDFLS